MAEVNNTPITLFFPSTDTEQNLNNGCYYFKLKYNPQIDYKGLTANARHIESFTMYLKDTFLVEGSKKVKNVFGDNRFVGSFLSNVMNKNIFSALTDKISTDVLRQTFSTTVDNTIDDATKNTDVGVVGDTVEKIYYQNVCSANIFLPLNSMNINRKSGINASDNIYSDNWYMNNVINASKDAIKKTGADVMQTFKGYTESKGKGYEMTGSEFDNISLEWDLMPHNEKEMENLLDILTFFQCSCISNMNLNDKQNLYWILPPKCEMGIIVTSADNRDDDLRREDTEVLFDDKAFVSKNKRITTKLLRQMEVYVKNVEITPLSNSGGVLLSPEGYPMGFKLKVSLIRSELVTLKNIQDYTKNITKLGGNFSADANENVHIHYNPFA